MRRADSSIHRDGAAPVYQSVATLSCTAMTVLGAALHFAGSPFGEALTRGILALAYLAGGILPTYKAAKALRKGMLDVDLLMILAAAGAAIIDQWVEGAVLLMLFSLSDTLERFAMYRTKRSIEALVQLRPREAMRVKDAQDAGTLVPVESLQVGDVLRYKPGDRFAVDGPVIQGETWADESTLTGESELVHKPAGAMVFAGTINARGSVLVRMTRPTADTTLQRIIEMVQQAQAQKTPAQQMIESWRQPYVMSVLGLSLVMFLAKWAWSPDAWQGAFYDAMVLLVAASPCAVVVSTPAVLLSAIARAGRHGILFKGGSDVESLSQVDVIAMDKTGTITRGRPGVTSVWSSPAWNDAALLATAAALEHRSEHPLGLPVVEEALRRGLSPATMNVNDFHSETGLGVVGRVDEQWAGVGREKLFERAFHDGSMPIPADLAHQAKHVRQQGQTALLVLTDNPAHYGLLAVADQMRPEAPGVIDTLKRMGIRRVVMLTGDHQGVGETVGKMAHADEVRAGLLPEQKVDELRQLARDGSRVAMVGDGVNDAPALATAAVGIAMGGAGTDVALETADVVLMRDDLRALPVAVWLSRRAHERVRQNMLLAFGMIGVLVVGTFIGLPLWLGVIGHEGSTVLVVFNGLRLLWEKPPRVNEPSATA